MAKGTSAGRSPAPTDASDLVRHFAGVWVTMSQSTQTIWREYYFDGDLYGKHQTISHGQIGEPKPRSVVQPIADGSEAR